MKRNSRVKIVTGLKCNIHCVFCYYQDNLNAPNRSFQKIKQDLLYAKHHGITEVDFSGGEPTIHPDIAQLIAEAKSMGMRRVCIISNGWRLADLEYLRSLKNAGLDEILFSLHGSQKSVHDAITTVPCSFDRILKAITHAVSEGIVVRTNTVVNRINYTDLSNISSLLLSFKPVQVNFITINDWCFAKNLVDTLMLSYADMSPYLRAACDQLENQVNSINVRYIPFCFMAGYESFVCDQRQVPYDPFEWTPRVRARLEVQNNALRYVGILAYGFTLGGVFKDLFRKKFIELMDDSVIEALRRWYYVKNKNCGGCKYDLLCDGIEKTYALKYGLSELSPCTGDKLADPSYYRKKP